MKKHQIVWSWKKIVKMKCNKLHHNTSLNLKYEPNLMRRFFYINDFNSTFSEKTVKIERENVPLKNMMLFNQIIWTIPEIYILQRENVVISYPKILGYIFCTIFLPPSIFELKLWNLWKSRILSKIESRSILDRFQQAVFWLQNTEFDFL